MSTYASNTKLHELSLVDGPDMTAPAAPPPPSPSAGGGTLELAPAPRTAVPATPAPIAPAPAGAAPPAVAQETSLPQQVRNEGESYDPFIAEALHEFERGQVEQPLWVRSLAQVDGKVESAKPVYIRARAVALRLERRTRRAEVPGRGELASTGRASSNPSSKGRLPDGKWIALAVIGLAIVVGSVAVLVAWLGGSSSAPAATGTAPSKAAPAAARRAGEAKVPEAGKQAAGSGEDFAGKIQSLKDAGNWNVLVLYAVEWTRKEPANAQAWKELSGGYLRMRQFDDALDATRKAVQMQPNDAQLWQNLGQINVALRQPAPALAAFAKAAELNEHDVTSRVQAGSINLELGHLPEARAAFASALAINPLDVEALCGSASVARKEGRTKDVDTFVHSAKAAGLECREPEAPPPVVAAPSPPPTKKPAAPRGR